MKPAWDLTVDDLRDLGYARDPSHLFGRLHRVWTWENDAPALSKFGREFIDAHGIDLGLPAIVEERPAEDGSTCVVLMLADGERIEAVHMPRASGRTTICLSSQVGCAMACTFCATAKMGLRRNMTPSEIVGQLLAILQRFGPKSAETLNIVFMGMGEPLHNVDAIVRVLDVLCDSAGLGVAPSRITVSTAGHVAGLDRLAKTAKYLPELAVSVNAASDDVRRHLMPIDKKWPLADLRAAIARWPQRPHQKITFEYVLLDGMNDDLESADRFAAFIGSTRHIANVIPFNGWSGSLYREPPKERVDAFVARLREHGCFVIVRATRGRDTRSACGTLAVF